MLFLKSFSQKEKNLRILSNLPIGCILGYNFSCQMKELFCVITV